MLKFDNHVVQLYQADASNLPIPSEAVDCVVTSPPYWGLRDYETTEWSGGDPLCNHRVGRFEYPISDKQHSNLGSGVTFQARDICPKCGAKRSDDQLGLEPSPEAYSANLVKVFREVWRVLKPSGTVWLNLGDSFADKQLTGIPWRVAFALQADGWYLRSDIIWSKPNPMPESVRDRPTKAHEYIFLLSKNAKYYYDDKAIKEPSTTRPSGNRARQTNHQVGKPGYNFGTHIPYEPDGTGRNKRSVWEITTAHSHRDTGAHFATFPERLVEPCILAGAPIGGVVLDPFVGSGTTLVVAQRLGRLGIGVDLSDAYLELAIKRMASVSYSMFLNGPTI